MDENIKYDIVWDTEEAEVLDRLARVILKDKSILWTNLLVQIKDNPEIFEGNDLYDVWEYIEDEEGDLSNGQLTRIFLNLLYIESIIEPIDWKGEDEEGQLARFAAKRVQELTQNDTLAAELAVQLLSSTTNDEIEKVSEDGDSYLDLVFERIQQQLNELGFEISNFNTGSDTYTIFVVLAEDYQLIMDIDTSELTVQNFLG